MARRGVPLLLVCASVAVAVAALAVGVSGQQSPPPPLPPNFMAIHAGQFGAKRNFEFTCFDRNRPSRAGCNATCPNRCADYCLVFCPTCLTFCPCDVKAPGIVCGDPRFTGGDGNTFYFHGKKDADFCLLSDSNLHINAHFIGKRNPAINRDFTWVQSLGIRFDNHHLYVGAQQTVSWDDDVDRLLVTFDGEPVHIPNELNARWSPPSAPELSLTRTKSANAVVVELAGKFRIMAGVVPITKEDSRIHKYGVTDDDSLAHLDLAFKFYSLSPDVHGVLGQTYRPDYVNKLDVRANMPVMGGGPNFASSGIFSTDCAVARFGRDADAGIAMVTESKVY